MIPYKLEHGQEKTDIQKRQTKVLPKLAKTAEKLEKWPNPFPLWTFLWPLEKMLSNKSYRKPLKMISY